MKGLMMPNVLDRINEELLRKVVDHAISADNWLQTAWVVPLTEGVRSNPWLPKRIRESMCDTAMCVAGFTAIDFGGWKRPRSGMTDDAVRHPETGETAQIRDVARKMLGLTLHEADLLFYSHNTATQLLHIVDEIVAGRHAHCDAGKTGRKFIEALYACIAGVRQAVPDPNSEVIS